MGYFEFDASKPHGKQITKALVRRGLVPCMNDEWEIHGPHGLDFPQAIFIGYAHKRGTPCDEGQSAPLHRRSALMVRVHPHATYEIESGDASDWWKPSELRRIPTIRAAS